MRYALTSLILLLALRSFAQFSVGSQGMTILIGTTLAVDGLTLTPSTNLSIANNSITRISTPLAGSPSINRLYQFGNPILFSGTAGLFYLPSELNGYTESILQLAYTPAASTSLTITSGSTLNTSAHYVSNSLSSQNLFVVTASAFADLSPVILARPSTVNGTSPISVVVDVLEVNGAPSSGPITVRLSKDDLTSLTFNPGANVVGGVWCRTPSGRSPRMLTFAF